MTRLGQSLRLLGSAAKKKDLLKNISCIEQESTIFEGEWRYAFKLSYNDCNQSVSWIVTSSFTVQIDVLSFR